jgi:uncharacterized protein (TIGR00290 family)
LHTPVVLSFSGGKDSVLAAAHLRAQGYDVRAALAAFVAEDERLVMHRVPRQLIAVQSASLGLPLVCMRLPRDAPNSVYEAQFAAALESFRAEGVNTVAFGDLFLPDIRAYREALMARLGLRAVYPLWGQNTRDLADRFVGDGYRGIAVCVDESKLGPEWAGREMNASFFTDLPPTVDPCGENGEFHSFVYDGPEFAYAVRFERGQAARVAGFHYCELRPLPSERCARCGAAFECGMKAGNDRCWCADSPAVMPEPALTGCLCPRCLRTLRAR